VRPSCLQLILRPVSVQSLRLRVKRPPKRPCVRGWLVCGIFFLWFCLCFKLGNACNACQGLEICFNRDNPPSVCLGSFAGVGEKVFCGGQGLAVVGFASNLAAIGSVKHTGKLLQLYNRQPTKPSGVAAAIGKVVVGLWYGGANALSVTGKSVPIVLAINCLLELPSVNFHGFHNCGGLVCERVQSAGVQQGKKKKARPWFSQRLYSCTLRGRPCWFVSSGAVKCAAWKSFL